MLGGLDLAIEGPSKAEISCVDNKDGTCTVTYLPTLPGDYNILVRYNDKHIPGSPFTARVTGESKWIIIFIGCNVIWTESLDVLVRHTEYFNDWFLHESVPKDQIISIRNLLSVPVCCSCLEDNKRRSQVKLGSAADFTLDINETDLSLLSASIKAPSGRDEPCLLKRQPNNHIGKMGPPLSQRIDYGNDNLLAFWGF